jgi:hypothetical protein
MKRFVFIEAKSAVLMLKTTYLLNSMESTALRDLDEILDQISTLTGLSDRAIRDTLISLKLPSFQFEDTILISSDAVDNIIDAWAEQMKSSLQNNSGSKTSLSRTVSTNAATVEAPAPTTRGRVGRGRKATSSTLATAKPGRKPGGKPGRKAAPSALVAATPGRKPGRKPRQLATAPEPTPVIQTTTRGRKSTKIKSLPLPPGYPGMCSHLYGPTLQRIMPADAAAQQEFLSAIAYETEAGKAFLEEVSVIIADKYGGKMSPDAAYNGMIKKAKELLGEKPEPKQTKRRGAKTVRVAGRKPKLKAAAIVSPNGLELPKGYRKRVSNRYSPTLKSILPGDTALRDSYLQAIVAETEEGKEFLQKVATSIQNKYKGRISSHTAYQGLLEKAKALI